MRSLKALCDALAAGLAAKTWTSVETHPTVERVNWPTYSAAELAHPVIAITPGGDALERVDRLQFQHDLTVHIFVARHVATDAQADAMLTFSEELLDAITFNTWAAEAQVASPMTVNIEINPDGASQDRNVWRAVITATYRTFR